ncbi:hypothetical protein Sru01_54910 [Sphaerisporangium rufum]|uniref:Uncharacterized protein n=1 Tax=Sphaerisporangium rufum TaxID=1381558 RepID=A0A919R6Q3_9ACTN|nr:hypothetical protein [Sphaerisporangium rufum]GII80509.1 hypothetical protein Sru01_54910 [Sphaerisporangium rufum]
MGEFVGINPHAARNLLAAMDDTAQRAAALRSNLSASIAEAGADWPAGPGAEVLDRCRRFLLEAHRDLTWRVQTIERTEDAEVRAGVKGAEFLFPSAESARAAGTVAGGQVKAAWQAYQADPSPETWQAVQAALAGRQGKTSDTEYAAGLLAQLGAGAFAGIMRTESRRHQNSRSGYSPADLARVRKDLGPLADALGAADSAGKAPADLKKRLLDDVPLDDLAALLALAPQSSGFVAAAGTRLAKGSSHKNPAPNWNTHWLVQALGKDLHATQQFLATKGNAELLLRPEVVKGTGTPDFERHLATALDKALAPAAGDDTLRRAAWINVIKVFGDRSAWPSLAPTVARDPTRPMSTATPSPIAQVLTKHIHQYFADLAPVWAIKEVDEKGPPPGQGWRDLNVEEVTNFFGALLSSPEMAAALIKDYEGFVKGLDLGRDHPFGDGPTAQDRTAERNAFHAKATIAASVASLLISGTHLADLNAEAIRDAQIQLMFFPVDIAVGAFGGGIGGGLASDAAIGKMADFVLKNPGQDFLKDLWDGASPEEATHLTNSLLDRQMAIVEASRQQHGLSPLPSSDVAYLRTMFRGLLLPVVLDSLKERGG